MSHQHARIEELSDTDSDPPEDDLSTFEPPQSLPHRPAPSQAHPNQPPPSQQPPPFRPPADYKTYTTLYPIYFDASRTRSQGRRVGAAQAVANPLAREIVDAVQMLGLKSVFEPGKMHPKDWGNPGRVRVGLKEGKGGGGGGRVKNKHHLYTLVSTHLRAHPTIPTTPLRLHIHGMPTPEKPPPPPAVPRGWKINEIVPLHSPALSGGGVSENMFRDMMQEMQGGMPGGMPGMPGMGGSGSGGGGGMLEGGGQGKRKREGGGRKGK